MPTFGRYLARKALWYLGALVAAVVLNWYLPRLIPGNPVDALMSQLGRGGVQGEQLQRIHAAYVHQFHLDLQEGGLVLRGHAMTYYAKQLAQHAVMAATSLPIQANEIEVV